MSVSVFDHVILQKLFSAPEMDEFFSVRSEIETMLLFERELAQAQAEIGIISVEAANNIEAHIAGFTANIDKLSEAVSIDGVIVPELVQQLRESNNSEYSDFIHFGCTSQDVIDTSLVLRLSRIIPLLDQKLEEILKVLKNLRTQYGSKSLMARTRMQRALPITVTEKIATWVGPIEKLREDLPGVADRFLILQLGGAVGINHAYGGKGRQLVEILASRLGLQAGDGSWHTNRHNLVRFADWLSHIVGALAKIGQDIVLLSQNEVQDIILAKGGKSSVIPNKNNPVKAEIIITLSRYQASQVSVMHQSLVHENERSGSMWALEWLTLPSMIASAMGAMRNAQELLEQIEFR